MFKHDIGDLVLYKMPHGIQDVLGMITKQIATKNSNSYYDVEWYNTNGSVVAYMYGEQEVDIFKMDYINAQGR
jgi:hypothetical protein